MKNILLIASIAVLLTSACNKDRIRLKGEGPTITEERSASDFDQVKLNIDANVIWHKDTQSKIIVEAQKNIAEFLLTEQRGDQIIVKFKPLTTVRKHNQITIHLFSPSAEAIDVSGSGEVMVQHDIASSDMDIRISGSGDVKLNNQIIHKLEANISGSGSLETNSIEICESAEYRISGSGKIKTLNTPTNNVDVHISGSGKAELNVSKHLDAKISGSGKVRYSGSPTLNSTITGSGKIEKI